MLFLGRHAGYPVALEGALKLKELAYIHAEGFAAGELKHGPIALVEEGMPVFCVVPPQGRDFLHEKMVSGIQEVRARGARTIVLAEEDDESVKPYADVLDPAAQGADAAAADGGRGAAAALRLRARHRDGPRRGHAAQPRQVRHGRVGLRAVAVIGVGIDVVDIGRFEEALERTPTLRERLFTEQERERPLASLAARFAAKEALAKALGAPTGMHWLDAEVVSEADRQPAVRDPRLGARPAPTTSAPAASTSPSPTTPASPRRWSSSRTEVVRPSGSRPRETGAPGPRLATRADLAWKVRRWWIRLEEVPGSYRSATSGERAVVWAAIWIGTAVVLRDGGGFADMIPILAVGTGWFIAVVPGQLDRKD